MIALHEISNSYPSKYGLLMRLVDEFSAHMNSVEGKFVTGRSHKISTREAFEAMPAENQDQILAGFGSYYSLLQRFISSGGSMSENRKMATLHMAVNGLVPPDGVMEFIDQETCLEIYNKAFNQTFRSPNFFDYCSHSLEDLVVLPYWELFRKSEAIEKQIWQNATAIMSGRITGPMFDFVDTHTVKEINSPKMLSTRLDTILASPLFSEDREGEVVGLLHICRVEAQYEPPKQVP